MAIILNPEIPLFWQVKGDILEALGSDEAQAAYDMGDELEETYKPIGKAEGVVEI